ncbi:MAG: hypothetical protein IAF94_22495 [Pirellulaceae bacterium]|nr:hypothetical protein [Pirellulaceae bacterium]
MSIGLVVLGIKGFTASGIPLSKKTTLQGTSGKIVGAICIMAGVAFIPLFLLAFWGYGRVFGQ